MEKKNISKIIDFVKETDLIEFSLVKNDSKIYFRRQAGKVKKLKSAASGQAASGKAAVGELPPAKKQFPIKSLMVGTFYHSASDDRPPFVVNGSKVVSGQKVGVIEAMKVMKDVFCTVKGRIVKTLVENGSHVEYGQELFTVDAEK